MNAFNSEETETLIDQLLAEQRSLTAVARFTRQHVYDGSPAQERYYRDLLPLHRPRAGEQYAFEVDLDKCSGCKACVTACHSLNGLEDEETWRSVGLLHGGSALRPMQQTVTTACHHCVEPACAEGCPVLAYEKDPVTGIVRHLDDQCIGCQYCVLKCPYEVPKYSDRLGIVRKCDLCTNRLAADEAPACVQACPSEAIRITVIEQRVVSERYRETETVTNQFLPSSPDPAYTLPTTRYKSARPFDPSLRAADAESLKPQCAHTPLGIMLVLSQLSVGAFLVERCWNLFVAPGGANQFSRVLALGALLFGWTALAVSTAHLGRPLGAWRAFLGLRRSWLSREIVVFGLFALMAPVHTAGLWFPKLLPEPLVVAAGGITLLSGLLGVFCSAMIYHDTRREFWKLPRSAGKFFGTTALLGLASGLLVATWFGLEVLTARLAVAVMIACSFKLAVELPILRWLEHEGFSPLHKTALLLNGPLGTFHRVRIALGIIGGVLVPALTALGVTSGSFAPFLLKLAGAGCFALCLAGELIERRLFFTAVQPVKMPGGVTA